MFENEISPLEQYVPTFIPTDFVRKDKSLWFNRMHIGLQLFYQDSLGHFIRLELSVGPIGDLMSMTSEQIQRRQLDVAGLKVDMTSIKASARSGKDAPPLISANWEQPEVYFRLQSNGLTVQEVKNIVASTLK
jgi:hypothetical protein